MNRILSSLFIFLVCVSAVQAQSSFKVPDLKGALGIEAGDYKFYDPTQVQINELNEAFSRAETDRDFYFDYISKMNDDLLEIIKVVRAPKNSLAQMSQDSLAGAGPADHLKYLEFVRDYQTRKEGLLLKARSLATSMEALAPSKIALESSEAEKQMEEIPQYSNINFSQAVEIYETSLANLEEFAKSLGYKIKLRNGVIQEIAPDRGLGLDLKISYVVYSDEELDEMQKQIKLWREYDRAQMQTVSSFATYGRQRIQNFIENYGKNEKYRPRDNTALENMVKVAEEISNYFWARDAVRAVYGLPLGAIYGTYKTQWFMFDRFKLGDILTFEQQLAYSDADLDKLSRNNMEAVKTAKAQRARVTQGGQIEEQQIFGDLESRISEAEEDLSLKIADGEVGVLSKINSFGQFLLGRRALADVYYYMLRLLLADVASERTLRSGGQQAMIERYKQRYRNTQLHHIDDDNKEEISQVKYFDSLYALYFKQGNNAEGGKPNRGVGPGGMTAGAQSLTKFANDLRLLGARKQNDLNRAWQNELLLWQASQLGDSGSDVINQAEEDIFGDDQ